MFFTCTSSLETISRAYDAFVGFRELPDSAARKVCVNSSDFRESCSSTDLAVHTLISNWLEVIPTFNPAMVLVLI